VVGGGHEQKKKGQCFYLADTLSATGGARSTRLRRAGGFAVSRFLFCCLQKENEAACSNKSGYVTTDQTKPE
jgi:hypothetical protein